MQLFLRTYEISKHDGFQREPSGIVIMSDIVVSLELELANLYQHRWR